MTTGEMKVFTKRLKGIVCSSSDQGTKDKRLSSLMDDLQQSFDLPLLASRINKHTDMYAMAMYQTASEHRSL